LDDWNSFSEGDRLFAIQGKLFALLNDLHRKRSLKTLFNVSVELQGELNLLGTRRQRAANDEVLSRVGSGNPHVDAGMVEVLQIVTEFHEELTVVFVFPL
jgi:hypothetical protein